MVHHQRGANETAETLISEVEWDADDRNAFRAAPFIGEINGRFQRNAGAFELAIELLDQRLESRAFNGQAKFVDSLLKERFALFGPVVSGRLAELL